MMDPWKMMALGFVLLLIGVVFPFLMLLHILESTLLLNFFAYGSSVTGLLLGLMGTAMYASFRKPDLPPPFDPYEVEHHPYIPESNDQAN